MVSLENNYLTFGSSRSIIQEHSNLREPIMALTLEDIQKEFNVSFSAKVIDSKYKKEAKTVKPIKDIIKARPYTDEERDAYVKANPNPNREDKLVQVLYTKGTNDIDQIISFLLMQGDGKIAVPPIEQGAMKYDAVKLGYKGNPEWTKLANLVDMAAKYDCYPVAAKGHGGTDFNKPGAIDHWAKFVSLIGEKDLQEYVFKTHYTYWHHRKVDQAEIVFLSDIKKEMHNPNDEIIEFVYGLVQTKFGSWEKTYKHLRQSYEKWFCEVRNDGKKITVSNNDQAIVGALMQLYVYEYGGKKYTGNLHKQYIEGGYKIIDFVDTKIIKDVKNKVNIKLKLNDRERNDIEDTNIFTNRPKTKRRIVDLVNSITANDAARKAMSKIIQDKGKLPEPPRRYLHWFKLGELVIKEDRQRRHRVKNNVDIFKNDFHTKHSEPARGIMTDEGEMQIIDAQHTLSGNQAATEYGVIENV